MTIWEKVLQKSELAILGPLALVCTLAVGAFPMDLLVLGIIGLYLCARWHLKGFTYALFLLAVVGVAHHLISQEKHLWQLGLEISMGCAFFITALSFEQNAADIASLTSQLDAKDATLRNVEEDLNKEKEETATEKITLSEKVALLQKELEELQSEQNSLLVLNDVLRKTAAKHLEEKAAAEEREQEERKRLAELQEELATAQRELERISNEEQLAKENRTIFEELNAARLEKEQTHQVNASLVRLHAKEANKVKKLEEQIHSLSEERNFLKDRLQSAEFASGSKDGESQQKLHQTESLYRQLKKQFEEKNEVLEKTRAELFQTDTALQTLKIENEQKEHVFPGQMQQEIEQLEKEVNSLQKENQELLDVVSRLSNAPSEKKNWFNF